MTPKEAIRRLEILAIKWDEIFKEKEMQGAILEAETRDMTVSTPDYRTVIIAVKNLDESDLALLYHWITGNMSLDKCFGWAGLDGSDWKLYFRRFDVEIPSKYGSLCKDWKMGANDFVSIMDVEFEPKEFWS